jgi:hypothetical protein
VEAILTATLGTEREVPIEWLEFRLCQEFHCLPADLDAMPQTTFLLWIEFLSLQAKAGRLKASQAKFYGH